MNKTCSTNESEFCPQYPIFRSKPIILCQLVNKRAMIDVTSKLAAHRPRLHRHLHTKHLPSTLRGKCIRRGWDPLKECHDFANPIERQDHVSSKLDPPESKANATPHHVKPSRLALRGMEGKQL